MNEKKKLYRVTDNKKIAGVCGGVAEYLDLDVTIVRLVWAILAVCWLRITCIYNRMDNNS